MSKTAISFNVPPRLWNAFRKQTDALFLSRAPFLDCVLASELHHLRTELEGLRLTMRAKRHIAGAMKREGPVSVNIEVRPQTANALREAVRAHNLVRDAFMSRLLLFLRSTDALLEMLEVPRIAASGFNYAHLEEMPASPLGAMEAVRNDPLFYVRANLQSLHQTGIYLVLLPRQLDWAACYLEDELIPGTAAYRRSERRIREMRALFEDTQPMQQTKTRRTRK